MDGLSRGKVAQPGRIIGRRGVLLGATSLAAVTACAPTRISVAGGVPTDAALGGLPYHPVPFHMDLCILSYQLYAQSLVWPFDPFYEKLGDDDARDVFMGHVRDWAGAGPSGPAGFGYRGPGRLQGFADNAAHDPVVFRYDRLQPWQPGLTLGVAGPWTALRTPGAISDQIADVRVCARPRGGVLGAVDMRHVSSGGRAGARDQLIAFEGGTGDKGEPGQPASQSLMGFVLKRHIAGTEDYDIHITFRGSRSGSAARAARQALSEKGARGNPDWITDLGYDFVDDADDIAVDGQLHRGLVESMRSILPKIRAVLAALAGRRAPQRIFVTGHSLGGGLAQHFASAVLLGNQMGPDGAGPAMPAALRDWPWAAMKLVTFAAPVSGDADWARALTEEKLQSQLFRNVTIGLSLTDADAIPVSDTGIVGRLMALDRPVGYRVLNPVDPITTLHVLGGKHVGQTVYIARAGRFARADPAVHEPADIRERITAVLADTRIPSSGWAYLPLAQVSPDVDPAQWGQPEVFAQLSAAIGRYYVVNGAGNEVARLRQDFALYQQISTG